MNTATPITRPCITCDTADTVRGLECPRCNAISTAMAVIWTHYDEVDAGDLAETLAGTTVAGFRQIARDRKAGMMIRIGETLRRCAYMADMDDDSMRLAVVRKIKEHLTYCKKVRNYENDKHEAGAYLKRIVEHEIPEWAKLLRGKAA